MKYIKAFIFDNEKNCLRDYPVLKTHFFCVTVGLYDADQPDLLLTDITSEVTFSEVYPGLEQGVLSFGLKTSAGGPQYLFFQAQKEGSFVFEFSYVLATNKYTCLLNYECIKKNELPNAEVLSNVLASKEPFVYTDRVDSLVNLDRKAMASVFDLVYQDLQVAYDQITPFGGNFHYEYSLLGSQGVVSENPQYARIMQILFSLLANNSCQKYDFEFILSKFIYYFTGGTKVWCFLREVLTAGGQQTANPYLTSVFVVGVETIFIPEPEIQNLFFSIASKMVPYWFDLNIEYGFTLETLSLTQNIGMVFKEHPSLFLVDYAIYFDPLAVEQAWGIINPHSIGDLVSLTIYPVSGTTLRKLEDVAYTIVGTYNDGTTVDLTQYAEKQSGDLNVLGFTEPPDPLLIPKQETSSVSFSAYYAALIATATYSIEPPLYWQLDVSALDLTTRLAP